MSIYNKEAFDNNPAMGFDGLFDWDWTKGCLGQKFITPMDIDGITERNGNFLVFETKMKGNPVPSGQWYTLLSLYNLGCFTIVFCDKTNPPTQISVWCANGFKNGKVMSSSNEFKNNKKFFNPNYVDVTPEQSRNFITNWYSFADNEILIEELNPDESF